MAKPALLKPTGPYIMGVCKFDLFDENRPEMIYPQRRLIPIQVTFPMEKGHQIPQQKIFELRAPKKFSPLEVMGYSKLSDFSQLVSKNCPLVFFNHGDFGTMTDYAMIIEELASHGYVVISIQHQLDTDLERPSFSDRRSISKYSAVIDNILHVFEWVKQNNLFKDKIDINKVGLIGYSLSGSALLMLAQIISGLFQPDVSMLLPRDNCQYVKECMIIIDSRFTYPPHVKYPILFCLSEEYQSHQEKSGALEDLKRIGHSFKYYKGSKHISFMDHGWALETFPNNPKEQYFNGTYEEREFFWKELRKDILEFLNKTLVLV